MFRRVRHYLRRIHVFNYLGRKLLKCAIYMGSTKAIQLAEFWPVWGWVDCEFDNIRFKMLSYCDDPHANYFYYQTHYAESYQLRLFLKLAEKSKIVFDIGANSGHYSILTAFSGGPEHIFAFEPYAANFERLQRNVNANVATSIHCENIALGNTNGLLTLSVPANGGVSDVVSANHSFPQSIYPGTQWQNKDVEQKTLDSFIDSIQLCPDLMKLDVETFEKEVLEGARLAFSKCRPVVFCEILKMEVPWWTEWLSDFRYQLVGIGADKLQHIDVVSDNMGYSNYILIPEENLNETIKLLQSTGIEKK